MKTLTDIQVQQAQKVDPSHIMQIGMNGDATIILEERTLYYYFFRKAKQVYYLTTMSY